MRNRVRGEIFVGFSDELNLTEIERIVEEFGLLVTQRMPGRNTYLVEVPMGSTGEWIEKFKQLASVKFSESHRVVSLPKVRSSPKNLF